MLRRSAGKGGVGLLVSSLLSSGARVADSADQPGLTLRRAFWLLVRLRFTRWKNRGRASFWGTVVAPAASSSPRRTTSAGSGIGLLFWAVLIVALLCLQSSRLFEQLVREHGHTGMRGRAALMSSLNTVSLLLMVLLGSSTWDRESNTDAEWLATLPAAPWVLHTAKVAEAALSNVMGWMLLFPFFTGLALHVGLGVLAPLVALAICVPIFLGVGVLGSVVDLAGLATSHSRSLRVLRFVGPAVGALIFALALLSSGLSGLNIQLLGDWLGFSQALAWLPFSEPAQALLSSRTAPLHALGWFVLFAGEMVALLGLGALLLRRIYRAELVTGGSAGRGARAASSAAAGALRRRSLAGWFGAVAAKDLLWLRRNPARSAGLASQAVIGNALGILLVPRIPGLDSAALPGVALFGVGGLLVSNLSIVLDPERRMMSNGAVVPRSLSWFFFRKASFTATLGTLAALPSAGYLLYSLPSVTPALPALAYGLTCVVVLACIQTSLWLRHSNPDASTSALGNAARTLQLLLAAAVLSTTFGSISRPDSLVSSIVLAAAFAACFWQGSVERVPFALDPSAVRPIAPSATGTLVMLVVIRVLQAGIFSAAARGGVATSTAAAVAFVLAGVSVLGARLLWLRLSGATGLRRAFGLTSGRGGRAVLQQGLLWSLPAIGLNLAYWPLVGQWLVKSTNVTSQPAPIMTLLAGSASALVLVGCIAAPLIEELGYRGMFYGSLRSRWALLPSLLLSTIVFTADHTLLAAIPVLGLSVCATLAFERSGSLYAAVFTHALYNAVLTALTFVH